VNSLADLRDYIASHDVEWADVQVDVTNLGTPTTDPTLPADFASAYQNYKDATSNARATIAMTEASFSPLTLDVTPAGATWDSVTAAGGAITGLANRVAVAGGSLANTNNLPQPTAPDFTLDAYQALGDVPGVTPLANLFDNMGGPSTPGAPTGWPSWAKWAAGVVGVGAGLFALDKVAELYNDWKG
jgi:hypothetical protein